METFLITFTVVLLFLIYRKLVALGNLLDDKKIDDEDDKRERDQKNTSYQNWLYEKLKTLEEKVVEISDVSTVDNPAWGPRSASSRKKEKLVELYSQYLVENESMKQGDAHIKACFVINNFEGGVTHDIIRDAHYRVKAETETELVSSSFFKQEVQAKINQLEAKEIFEPLWIGIKIRNYKKGDTLTQSRRKSFEAHSGQYGYQDYVEDFSIIARLIDLGVFEIKKDDADTEQVAVGWQFFILKEDNLEKLRKLIFKEDERGSEYYDDDYFSGRHSSDDRIKLPFHQLGEFY